MEKVKAKVEQVLHKGDHSTTTHTSTTGAHTGTTTAGQTTGVTGSHKTSDPTGPHDSHLANKLDPRVDSDQIGGRGNTASAGGPVQPLHAGTHTGGLTGDSYGSDPTGPHDSRLANKADPRVDSDHVGGYGNTVGTGGYEKTHTGGLTGNTHTGHTGLAANMHGSDPTGPHDSHLANKVDPRVDSDRVGGYGNTVGAGGYESTHTGGLTGNTHTGGLTGNTHTGGLTGNTHTGHTGLTGNTYGSDPTGPHDSHLANKADPRVDSKHVGGFGNTAGAGGYDATLGAGAPGSHGLTGQGSHFPGPAPNTAGPHKSDLLNKADPRVDADMDGSKTLGGNNTYGN